MTYVNLTDAELRTLGRTLDADHCLSDAERELVAEQIEREGEIELDDEVVARRGADNGMYVMAWVWVDFPTCECGESTGTMGSDVCSDCAET